MSARHLVQYVEHDIEDPVPDSAHQGAGAEEGEDNLEEVSDVLGGVVWGV